MKRLFLLTFTLLGIAAAQDPFTPDYVVNTGASINYLTGESSALSSVLIKVTSIAGRPTYSVTTAERVGFKGSNSLSLRSGVCQVVYQRTYWGLMACTDAGITSFDKAFLGNFTGSLAVPIDLLAYVTKGKYHGYITPLARQVDIASRQVKPVWGIQIGTAFGR